MKQGDVNRGRGREGDACQSAGIQADVTVKRSMMFDALTWLGGLILFGAGCVNVHVLYLVGKAPMVVAWPRYLRDGHGSRLVDTLFTLSFLEMLGFMLIFVISRYDRHRRPERKRTLVWGCFGVMILMVLCNYVACARIASAC